MAKQKRTLINVSLDKLRVSPNWNRYNTCDLRDLVASLPAIGQIIPLIVEPDPQEKNCYRILDGHRRFLAMREVEMTHAIAIVSDSISGDIAELKAIVANLVRKSNTPMELSRALYRTTTNGEMSKKNAGLACGLPATSVSQYLKLQTLPDYVQKVAVTHALNFTTLRELSRLTKPEDAAMLKKMTKIACDRAASDRHIHQVVNEYEDKQRKKKQEKEGATPVSKTGRPINKVSREHDPKAAKPKPGKWAVDYIQKIDARHQRSRVEANQRYLAGVMDGLEIAFGLRDPL